MKRHEPGGGFFELSEETLFEKAQRDIDTFRDRNDHDSLFNAVCTVYHVRDWIEKSGKPGAAKFSDELFPNDSYQVLRGLCNAAKHCIIDRKGPKVRTDMKDTTGELGEAKVGEPLGGEEVYTVDGGDVREHLTAVLREYTDYFESSP